MKAQGIIQSAAGAGVVAILLGMQPALAEPVLYIPLGGEGKIAVIDTAQDMVVDTIGGVTAVHGLAGTPDGRFLIAGSYEERAPGSAAPDKPTGVTEEDHAGHHGAAPANAPKAAAAISIVSIVKAADRSIVRRIDVPGAVHHVAVSPNGRFAVLTHPNEGGISAIDLTSFAVLATVATGSMPNYSAFSLDSNQVYVSNAGDGTISAIDTSQWTVQWSAQAGASPEHVVLSKDGASLYVNNVDDGAVSILSLKERRVVKTIPIGLTLHGIDLSDDGKTLYVADLGDEKIVSVDLASGAMRTLTLAPAPYHLAIVRGTGKLYVSSADVPKVWVVDQKGLSVLGEIQIGGKGHQMVPGAGS